MTDKIDKVRTVFVFNIGLDRSEFEASDDEDSSES